MVLYRQLLKIIAAGEDMKFFCLAGLSFVSRLRAESRKLDTFPSENKLVDYDSEDGVD